MPVWLSSIDNPPSSNVDQVVDQPITIGGQTYAHTVQLQGVHGPSCTTPAFISFLVRSGETKLAGTYGWTSDTEPGSSDDLIVYRDITNTKPLWTHPFTNTGLPPVAKTLMVAGVHTLIFELAASGPPDQPCGIDSHGSTFVLADAQLSP